MSDMLVIGCGYLGRRVAECQRATGLRVFASTRSPGRADEFHRAGLEPVLCDVLDRDSLRALPAGADVVYCVGFDRTAGKSMRTVYVDGLENVLNALDAADHGRFVYVSSTGVYGQTGGKEVDETAATAPAGDSGRIVLDAENLLRERRPDAMILRFAGIYGPNRLIRAAALKAGEPLSSDPDNWLNLIHVEDGASAVIAAIERAGAGSVINVCDDHPVRRRDFYTRMAEVLGAPSPWFPPNVEGTVADAANRRIVNRRMHAELGVTLRYPSYREGLPASVDD
ncbi:MAG TPA: NAD(P)-dependent oxidoreductase [Planctomycetales bacterium]|jgi:nucleoside-diphosphate-sugar epimerase|nr:NAD(P)-dependent oxidoreductase [Planctomycetales bacterium]